MRTPEVEKAISNTKAGMYCTDDADTLAAEVERLEAGLVKANEAARATMYAIDERAFLAECAEKSEKRAEAAEARVKELEAQIAEVVGSQRNEDKSLPTWAQVMNRVALLTEQNARLREQVAELIAKELSNPVLRQIVNALAAAKPGEVVHLPGGSYFFGFTGKALNGEEANK